VSNQAEITLREQLTGILTRPNGLQYFVAGALIFRDIFKQLT